ncbi:MULTISPECIES: GNAT family N-acetyltransferase [Mumia]|uniref:GNAT family N-acetyltransferase n=1 Tax=Mumia xiangluensis TaxID=1678900 RepID=A0ABW1QK25_9ACTN|nr:MULTISPECIES: GNAT family N-acetyltransferase [Mumia]
MGRLPLEIREAHPDDARELIELWSLCVAEGLSAETDPLSVGWVVPTEDESRAALADISRRTSQRLCVAVSGEQIVGVMKADLAAATPLHLRSVVVVSELHVHPRHRRRGVAWSLMSIAADWADQVGSAVVYAWAPAPSRDAHRFLTRIGFGHFATVRAARVRVLQARLAGRSASGRGTGRLIAVRRSLRRTTEEAAAAGAAD